MQEDYEGDGVVGFYHCREDGKVAKGQISPSMRPNVKDWVDEMLSTSRERLGFVFHLRMDLAAL